MKKSITIGKVRTALYKTAKVLGDINAVKRNTITQRASNRSQRIRRTRRYSTESARIYENICGESRIFC